MNTVRRILVGAGDVGGARAILPALHELRRRGRPFDLLDHGFITTEAPEGWPRVGLPSKDAVLQRRLQADYQIYVFGTSVRDCYPLRLARVAQASGLPVICVLDNWMNYRRRLETDGQPVLLPDGYAVMDDLARDEAVADGVPIGCLRVVGQAALATLADEYLACSVDAKRERVLRESGWAGCGKRLVVFISEPASKDQGADQLSPHFRGYTEQTVLGLLAHCLQPFHESVQVGLVPHPREDAMGLLAHWRACQGRVQGGQLPVATGREAVFIAHGVCGMASLLLYEAMLLGKPVLSLQPSLRLPQLEFLRKQGVESFVTDEAAAPDTIGRWLSALAASSVANGAPHIHPKMQIHRDAPAALAGLIEEVGSGPHPLT
jgi:hypothetical protein